MIFKDKKGMSSTTCCVKKSGIAPGKVQLRISPDGSGSGEYIHLTREQARQLGDELIRLADELFFREVLKQESSHEQE